jgi:hypothetical protein
MISKTHLHQWGRVAVSAIRSLLLVAFALFCFGQEDLPEGVFAMNDPGNLQFPVSGYQVYLVGEMHGNQETKELFLSYLSQLYSRSNLRDVVLEEDQVYEEEAQAFVQNRRGDLPVGLCLRANILRGLHEFNQGLPVDKQIRVHLIDIDSPAQAIIQHLNQLKNRIGSPAKKIEIPEEKDLGTRGMNILNDLSVLAEDTAILSGLRTVRQSLIAYRDGVRIHIGKTEGNAAHPAREEAITANLLDVLKAAKPGPVLGLYGSLHVRRGSSILPDLVKGGTFQHIPMTGSLEKRGIKTYKICAEPMSGRFSWRQNEFDFPSDWAEQYKVNGGKSVGDILQRAPDYKIFQFDFSKGVRLSKNEENYSEQFDTCVLFRKVTVVENECSSPDR